MKREEEKVEKIKQAFFEYAKDNELSAFDTSNYFARQIMTLHQLVNMQNFRHSLRKYHPIINDKAQIFFNEFVYRVE